MFVTAEFEYVVLFKFAFLMLRYRDLSTVRKRFVNVFVIDVFETESFYFFG